MLAVGQGDEGEGRGDRGRWQAITIKGAKSQLVTIASVEIFSFVLGIIRTLLYGDEYNELIAKM